MQSGKQFLQLFPQLGNKPMSDSTSNFKEAAELEKQLKSLAKAKEGMRTPTLIHELLRRLPLLWRMTRLLPPPVASRLPYHLVHNDPLILSIPEDVYEYPQQWKPFFNLLESKKVYFLCRIRWSVEDANVLKIMDYYYNRKIRKSYRNFQFIFLANTEREYELLKKHHLNAIFCNQNCLVDERIYRIHKVQKQYDAIYNARTAPFKNFQLTVKIPNLALITYFTSNVEKQYFEDLKWMLPDAICMNFGEKKLPICHIMEYRSIPPEQLSENLCKAHCGLCLSYLEGANYASIEYLLSGLPVVSVPSIGGRDVFFDPTYCFIVDNTPESVAEGVIRTKSLGISPQQIRENTLKKMREHRERFIALIQNILDENNKNISAQKIFKNSFTNRMYKLQSIQDLKKSIQ